jgi:DUF2924 family protein
METGVVQAIGKLRKLSVPALQKRYREVIGEPLRSSNKIYLFRRIAWKLQAQALGDLSERARRRAVGLASEADIPAGQHRQAQPSTGRSVSTLGGSRSQRDWRLPPPGTLLARRFQGRDVLVKILEDGFEYQKRHFRSLSAIATEVTGTRWNGFLFFGLTDRRNG